jgi:DME family drug/metabolite transporter
VAIANSGLSTTFGIASVNLRFETVPYYRERDDMLTGYIFIILAACCWGFVGIFSSLAFAEGLGPMEVAFWRALISWGLFGSQAIVRKETYLKINDIPLLVVFSLLAISLYYISNLYAIKTGGAAFAAVLLYTAPAWVVICSFFVYKEKLTVNKILAVLLVIAGVFLISKTGGNSNSTTAIGFIAILSGLMSGFCYSLYYTIGKYFSSRYSLANLFLYVLPIGVLGILPFVEFTHKSPTAWASLVAVSLVSTFIGSHCYYLGLKYLEAGKASIAATIEPVVAAVAAYVIFGEYFTSLGYVGAVVIISALVLTIYKK